MPAVIGLDIGTSAYRAVEISKQNKKTVLEKAFVCTACADEDAKKATESLKNFVAECKFSTRSAVLSLRESKVFSTMLSLPFKTEKEVKSYLEIQGSKVFPRPLNELVYSFQILGPNEQNKEETDVTVVACGKEYVETLFLLAKAVGLKVLAVEPESYSIIRALGSSREPSLVVTMGSQDTDVMVIKNGYVSFSRNVAVGGTIFTKSIAQALSISEEQAEEYKRTYGLERGLLDGKVYNALAPSVDVLLGEVRRTINFYSTRNAFSVFKKVIFSGGSAVLPNLLPYSAESLGMEVELANPFANLSFAAKLTPQREKLMSLGAVYTVAVGLALKEVG